MRRSSVLFIFIILLVSLTSSARLAAAQSESGPVVIPVRVSLLVPGSLTIVFDWTDNVTASASSVKHSEYTLLTRQNYIVFTTNASDTFKIRVVVSYPAVGPHEFSVRAYSHNALSDYYVTFSLNCSTVIFDVDLTTAPAPRYPTAEEVAEAQSKYVADLLESLANSTEEKVNRLLENYTSTFDERLAGIKAEFKDYIDDLEVQIGDLSKRVVDLEHSVESINKDVSDLKSAFQVLVKDLDEKIAKLISALESFQANTWTSIVIVSCVFVGGIIGAVRLGGERGPVIAEVTPKGLKKPLKKASGKKKAKTEAEAVEKHDLVKKLIPVVALAVAAYFFIIILLSWGV
mgnify:CR=1 FL=1